MSGRRPPPLRPQRFPNRVRFLRDAAGISQEELGRRVNLSYQAVGKIERGDQALRTNQMERFAQALGCREMDLMTNSKEHPPEFNEIISLLEQVPEDSLDQIKVIIRTFLR